jgi:hypothetical protein
MGQARRRGPRAERPRAPPGTGPRGRNRIFWGARSAGRCGILQEWRQRQLPLCVHNRGWVNLDMVRHQQPGSLPALRLCVLLSHRDCNYIGSRTPRACALKCAQPGRCTVPQAWWRAGPMHGASGVVASMSVGTEWACLLIFTYRIARIYVQGMRCRRPPRPQRR